jgi:hypothetical protein
MVEYKLGFRRGLYRVIAHRLFGINCYDKLPLWLSWVFFPLQNLIRKISKVRVEFETNAYWVDGVWIPRGLLEELRTQKGVYKYKHDEEGSWLKIEM